MDWIRLKMSKDSLRRYDSALELISIYSLHKQTVDLTKRVWANLLTFMQILRSAVINGCLSCFRSTRTWHSLPQSLHIERYVSKDSPSVRSYGLLQQLNTIPGFYSAIFVLYLRYRPASKKGTEKTAMNKILFYSLCALYVLTAKLVCYIYHWQETRD